MKNLALNKKSVAFISKSKFVKAIPTTGLSHTHYIPTTGLSHTH
jgi:hypothetical protein